MWSSSDIGLPARPYHFPDNHFSTFRPTTNYRKKDNFEEYLSVENLGRDRIMGEFLKGYINPVYVKFYHTSQEGLEGDGEICIGIKDSYSVSMCLVLV